MPISRPNTPHHAQPWPNRGFSLIELLVSIAIIAVLLGILIPVLAKARQAAQRTACSARLRSLGQAAHLYADSNSQRVWSDADWLRRLSRDEQRQTPNRMPFLGDRPGSALTTLGLDAGDSEDVLRCPATRSDDPATLRGAPVAFASDYTMPRPASGMRLDSQVRFGYLLDPIFGSEPVTLAADSARTQLATLSRAPVLVEESALMHNQGLNDGRWGGGGYDRLSDRHAGRANMLLLDTTVEALDAPGDDRGSIAMPGQLFSLGTYWWGQSESGSEAWVRAPHPSDDSGVDLWRWSDRPMPLHED